MRAVVAKRLRRRAEAATARMPKRELAGQQHKTRLQKVRINGLMHDIEINPVTHRNTQHSTRGVYLHLKNEYRRTHGRPA